VGKMEMRRLCRTICKRLGLSPATPHGFRACFKTASGLVGQDPVLTEAALNHAIGTEVARRYDRREVHRNLLDRRRPLTEWWSDYVSGRTSPDNVVEVSTERAA
jgi:integrase